VLIYPQNLTVGYCGDGILDVGEECDCGDEFECLIRYVRLFF
jgi:hypothetical protein